MNMNIKLLLLFCTDTYWPLQYRFDESEKTLITDMKKKPFSNYFSASVLL